MDHSNVISAETLAGQLARFADISCLYVKKNNEEDGTVPDAANTPSVWNPIRADHAFRQHLISLADAQNVPLIHMDEYKVIFCCVKSPDSYCFFGPAALAALDKVKLHRFYKSHGADSSVEERAIPILSVAKILQLSSLAAGMLTGQLCTMNELLKVNAKQFPYKSTPDNETLHLTMDEEERNSMHHTYREELRITEAVEKGIPEEAVSLSIALDDKIGTIGSGYLIQTQRAAISAITVCTRAAIRGGLSPADAYQISDYYIQKLDQCANEASLTACRNEAVRYLAERVRQKKDQRTVSTYVESCCDYISRHYREKIYLNSLAEKMGITPTYLSHLFSREKGIPIQEYIIKIRVERAANLLIYSDSTIAEIGDYVNFPSQSYFGKIFKKYTGLTPKQYRNAHKPKEFS